MPLLLGNNGVDALLWSLRTPPHNYQPYAVYMAALKHLGVKLLRIIFALNLLKYFCSTSSEGIQQQGRTNYGSLDYTIIAIEADESTPLLVDRNVCAKGNCKNENDNEKLIKKYKISSWSIGSSNRSGGSACSYHSAKSFKSHFLELKVLIFSLIASAAISIAIYLLVIECKWCKDPKSN